MTTDTRQRLLDHLNRAMVDAQTEYDAAVANVRMTASNLLDAAEALPKQTVGVATYVDRAQDARMAARRLQDADAAFVRARESYEGWAASTADAA